MRYRFVRHVIVVRLAVAAIVALAACGSGKATPGRPADVASVRTGDEALAFAVDFPKPEFEELMRDNSVLEGQP